VADWEFARKVREMVAEAWQKMGQGAGSELSAWLDQAEQLAERIDPLAAPNVGRLEPDSG
jgi:hypothetical protein